MNCAINYTDKKEDQLWYHSEEATVKKSAPSEKFFTGASDQPFADRDKQKRAARLAEWISWRSRC